MEYRSVPVRYGSATQTLRVPARNLAFVAGLGRNARHVEISKAVDEALAKPYGAATLAKLASADQNVTIVIDDNTRLTPTAEVLPPIIRELESAGVTPERITIVVALGTHRPMTEPELAAKLGDLNGRFAVLQHDARGDLVHVGSTHTGTPILVNKVVAEADLTVAVGMILPHYPAGWSGGAKLLLPGVAGEDTIAAMHLLGVDDPTLLGNVDTPCRREMESFTRRVGLDFIVNVVLDADAHVTAVVAGDFIHAHRAGVRAAEEILLVEVDEAADLTVSSTAPVDYDFFQADKGLFSAALVTRKGGEIVLVSPCREGISPAHSTITDFAQYGFEELIEMIPTGSFDRLAAIEALYLKVLTERFAVSVYSAGLQDGFLEAFGLRRVKELQAAVDERIRRQPGVRIGILHQSAELLPRVRGGVGSGSLIASTHRPDEGAQQ